MAERVAENLNRALHELFAASPDMYLLGQDVLDPYGGAFKVTRGLSDAYPDRVLTTPLSENAMVGVASGLALRGNSVIVEFMFGDFMLLALDPIVNFAAKSVSMYGRPVPFRLLLRCPVGGNRGYGATHSQSTQKFLVGVPGLAIWEMSPFADAERILRQMLDTRRPAVLFEDKVLYTQRMLEAGRVDDDWGFEEAGGSSLWTVIRHRQSRPPDVVIIAAGGTAHRCLAAAAQMHDDISVTVAVPARLYPCDPDPVVPLLEAAGRVLLVEEGTPGGSWSAELAQRLHSRLWPKLLAPAEIMTSADSIIPAARHLEREVLVTTEDIVRRVVELRDSGTQRAPVPVAQSEAPGVASEAPGVASEVSGIASEVSGIEAESPGAAIVMPHLNANEDGALLVEWLVADGDEVSPGQPVAAVETTKTSTELEAPAAGRIRLLADTGTDQPFGTTLAVVGTPQGVAPTSTVPAAGPSGRERQRPVQSGVAAAVSRSHQTIPPAFAARDAQVDRALAYLDDLGERTGAPVDLGALLVGAIARLHSRHPGVFAAVAEDGTAAVSSAADVAVTIDAGNGLYLPVIKAAGTLPLDALADRLVELQMAALSGSLTEADLDTRGVGLGISLNLSSGADVVQPIIMPGLSCMVSVGTVRPFVTMDPSGTPQVAHRVTLGISHDHRVVNGRPAMELLTDLAGCLADPGTAFGSGE